MAKQPQGLTTKQAIFVKNKIKGMNNTDSAISAGYAPISASSQASRLLKNVNITKALDKVGFNDDLIADSLRINMEAGLGKDAKASDSIRALELASKLRGHLSSTQETNTPTTQTNIYIKELNNMPQDDLLAKVDTLTSELQALK